MKKSNIFDKTEDVVCSVCGKNLLEDPDMALLNIILNEDNKIVHVKPCCKGDCDHKISRMVKDDESSGWKDIKDFTNPYLYMKHLMSVLNSMFDGKGFENKEAFENYKKFVLSMYPYVTRNLTDEDKEQIKIDNMVPF